MDKPRGYVIYRGPSMITGDPIVAIALTKTTNAKTGNMVQTYILVDNGQTPIVNANTLQDVAVCGGCKHRHGTGGGCYVNLLRGPLPVWRAFMAGRYPHSLAGAMKAAQGRMVRLGSYGDPAAVPAHVWKSLLRFAAGHTGYTHQWATMPTDVIEPIMEVCMASVDNMWEYRTAKATGYRTFRIRSAEELVNPREIICPASAEAGRRRECITCRACTGGVDSGKADVTIIAHGHFVGRVNKTNLQMRKS